MRPAGGTRDERVARIALRLGVGGSLLSLAGAMTLALGQRFGSDFWRGVGTGVLVTLPLFFGVVAIKVVRGMDEYGRQLHQRAASVAFLVVMILAGSLIALEAALGLHVPAWALYVVGMLIWGLSAAVIARRGA
ncbi:hypothetical protein [Deinococcus apachensis]|uniref:hypothetical protein n=1 Tax=Deinococcus apachensis TaxID=309886 RepID=UPI000377BD6A|nr:hypothetical protein [Deinococcus apachensis]